MKNLRDRGTLDVLRRGFNFSASGSTRRTFGRRMGSTRSSMRIRAEPAGGDAAGVLQRGGRRQRRYDAELEWKTADPYQLEQLQHELDAGQMWRLHSYRLARISETDIVLDRKGMGEIRGKFGAAVGTRKEEDEEVPLTEVIAQLNERFGTEF